MIPDIGLVEMIVIGLVLFLVVGPERIPEVYAQIAGFMRKARSWVNETRDAFRQEAEQIKDPLVQAREVVRGEIDKATEGVASDLKEELRELREHGEVARARPLSEIYADMQQDKDATPDDDDASRGFMQGHQPRPVSESKSTEQASGQADKDAGNNKA